MNTGSYFESSFKQPTLYTSFKAKYSGEEKMGQHGNYCCIMYKWGTSLVDTADV